MLTNKHGVRLSMAVWLAEDTYDHSGDENVISVTKLIRSVRSTILSLRAKKEGLDAEEDIVDRIASKFGTAVHDSIEHAWVKNYKKSLLQMGVPQTAIDKISVNPTDEFMAANHDHIAVYMENRVKKAVGDFYVSGKYDFIGEGTIEDFKTTSTYKLTAGTSDEEYKLQLSIYKWLNPDKVTEDIGYIDFIFTDWSKLESIKKPEYPQAKVHSVPIPLMSYDDTDRWVKTRVNIIATSLSLPQEALPLCDARELWQKESVWKYYKDPAKALDTTNRSTRTFTGSNAQSDSMAHYEDMQFVGAVIEVVGTVAACNYCSGAPICTQRAQLIKDGLLKVRT
jgi:hypothetical protein